MKNTNNNDEDDHHIKKHAPYISESLLSQGAEGQDDADDRHPLQDTVHS